VAIVAGSPSERRRFLDIVLSLTAPGYLHALQKYRQVLAQRNALLRRGSPALVVSAWDDGLVSWGSRVIAARARWVEERAAAFSRHVGHIADGGDAAIGYDSSTPASSEEGAPLDPDQLAAGFAAELERARERELRRGMTLVGPHRDDLRIRGRDAHGGAWTDLRAFGSGGQQRTAAIALRMVEAETLRESSGEEPIILLDDVFAELDPGRSRRILEWVENEEGGQVILTAPKPTDIELRGGALARWTVRDGRVAPL
jgi:DNA replication and repair protein RecF